MAELADEVQGGEVINDSPIPAPPDEVVEAPVKEASEKQEKPVKGQSIRDALNSAVEKAKKDETGRLHAKDGKFAPKEKAVEAQAPVEIPKTEKDVQPKEPSTAIGPPPGWSVESKAAFASLPDPVKQDILKREKEVSDGFKSKSDELKRYQEIEQVLAPARAVYQRAGVQSDAEAIKRLFMWEGMIRQNPAYALQQLAQQYGVNLSPAQSSDQPSAAIQENPYIGQLAQEVQSLKSTIQQSEQQQVSK